MNGTKPGGGPPGPAGVSGMMPGGVDGTKPGGGPPPPGGGPPSPLPPPATAFSVIRNWIVTSIGCCIIPQTWDLGPRTEPGTDMQGDSDCEWLRSWREITAQRTQGSSMMDEGREAEGGEREYAR